MSAIDTVFANCRRERRAAFIPFLTAGDPDLRRTGDLMQAMVAGGADIIELGVPFSDPIADGPVIQAATQRALESAGPRCRRSSGWWRNEGKGWGCRWCSSPTSTRSSPGASKPSPSRPPPPGVDGVLCVDLPPEEAGQDFIPTLRHHGLDTIFLLSPTSTRDRFRVVDRSSTGFLYYVSRTGVTGTREELPKEMLAEVKRLRRVSHPLAVGFGISTPKQVAAVAAVADGVVVGSALVDFIGREQRKRIAGPSGRRKGPGADGAAGEIKTCFPRSRDKSSNEGPVATA